MTNLPNRPPYPGQFNTLASATSSASTHYLHHSLHHPRIHTHIHVPKERKIQQGLQGFSLSFPTYHFIHPLRGVVLNYFLYQGAGVELT